MITALWLSKKTAMSTLVFIFLRMFIDSHNLKSTLSERIQEEKLQSASSDNSLKELCCKEEQKHTRGWGQKCRAKKQDFFNGRNNNMLVY